MNYPEYPFYKTSALRNFLNEKSSAPLKKWGQNFLIDPKAVQTLLDSADRKALERADILLEIGPGLGALTHLLARTGKKLRLYEIDPVYSDWLKKFLPQAEVVLGDARETLLKDEGTDCFLFGNLPYYITSELILASLEKLDRLQGAVFLVQKEFAQRLTNEISSLGIYAGAYGKFVLKKTVKSGSFYPRPNVDSSILSYTSNPRFADKNKYPILEFLCRVVFWGKRKKIGSSIKEAPLNSFYPKNLSYPEETLRQKLKDSISNTGLSLEKRPEEMPAEDFYRIVENFKIE
ncbi:ribosomal RNA small subunit methyltransferase A [Leptospira fluminis]|uniref:Ribosomal RNA small subunit methyltransferase A n=1 Tax=Leptospira fluminis TaxID=2484979 RepID=A0A4R9GN86_9LEPT|nr:16S rRNA (adenine(1518)-N(6)/adenine(1519)-N(6))-dimethyltransferase RsmA [Leptospira fluminis]TGK17929.1 ribosomal RNA small subunit methyltransferase A [Leptospira fluminis]